MDSKVVSKSGTTSSPAGKGEPPPNNKCTNKGENGGAPRSGGRRKGEYYPPSDPRLQSRGYGPGRRGGPSSYHKKRGDGYGHKITGNICQAQEVTGQGSKPSAKGGNLNHLLNFTFERRGTDHPGALYNGRQGVVHRKGAPPRSHFSKEQFLQAVGQFVVSSEGDYEAFGASADLLVPWDMVEQVRLPVSEKERPVCPICLYPPTCARVTRCGHVYCYSCILHCLSVSECRRGATCPICFDIVTEKDLKSVVTLPRAAVSVGDKVTMTLMRRDKGSVHALPKNQWSPRGGQLHSASDPVDTCFLKLLVGGEGEITSLLQKDMDELLTQMGGETEESLESTYIRAAIRAVQSRMDSIHERQRIADSVRRAMDGAPVSTGIDQGQAGEVSVCPTLAVNQPKVDWDPWESAVYPTPVPTSSGSGQPPSEPSTQGPSCAGSLTITPEDDIGDTLVDSEDIHEDTQETHEDCDCDGAGDCDAGRGRDGVTIAKRRGMGTVGDCHYYYQCADGQPIFLHSVNARCLSAEYGGGLGLEEAPQSITATVVELECRTMDQDLRKRMKHLSHLPLHCQFAVAELALTPPLVSSKVLSRFSGEIEKRRKVRQKKVRQENRAQRKVEAESNRLIDEYKSCRMTTVPSAAPAAGGGGPPPKGHAPVTSADGGGRTHTVSVSSATSDTTSDPCAGGGTLTPDPRTFVPLSVAVVPPGKPQTTPYSFAKMVQAGQAKPPDPWPMSPHHRLPPPGGAANRAHPLADNNDEGAEEYAPPAYQTAFAADLSRCLEEAFEKGTGRQPDEDAEQPSGGRGKKKKKQRKILFTNLNSRAS